MHEVGQHMALYALPLPGVLGSNLEPTFENPELRFFSFKRELDQNIALYALPTVWSSGFRFEVSSFD